MKNQLFFDWGLTNRQKDILDKLEKAKLIVDVGLPCQEGKHSSVDCIICEEIDSKEKLEEYLVKEIEQPCSVSSQANKYRVCFGCRPMIDLAVYFSKKV